MSLLYPSFNPRRIAQKMLGQPLIGRDEWQSDSAAYRTFELTNVIIEHKPTPDPDHEAEFLGADMPWAEKHFLERVSGIPMNPPPSAAEWPWHQAESEKHTNSTGLYSHTYPERFWPKLAGDGEDGSPPGKITRGIRFEYGDYQDILNLLITRPFSRQAYLPIWFPEDTGSPIGRRVPCTLGYHFIRNAGNLDLNYFIRSCDITRHLRNDMYFAVRLLQHTCEEIANLYGLPNIGKVTMFISNLHMFENDAFRWA